MGWASGSRILDEVAEIVMPLIGPEDRPGAALELIKLFEDEDCDTFTNCFQPDIQRAYFKMYPLSENDE